MDFANQILAEIGMGEASIQLREGGGVGILMPRSASGCLVDEGDRILTFRSRAGLSSYRCLLLLSILDQGRTMSFPIFLIFFSYEYQNCDCCQSSLSFGGPLAT
jgi:hypothetical protein